MRTSAAQSDGATHGLRLLLADDDPWARTLYATLLRATAGVGSVIEASDGAAAVALGHQHRLDVAVLDLNMPRLDGLAAALCLLGLQPSLQVALHSSDPELLRRRAAGLKLPLFDKVDADLLLAWVERLASSSEAPVAQEAPKRDVYCVRCGYGIVIRHPLKRCPMCGEESEWAESLGSRGRGPARCEHLSG